MRIGIISDAHGNIHALNAALNFLASREVARIVFLGDAVGYLPFGIEVLQLLRSRDITCVMGNHEAMLLGTLPVSGQNEDVYRLQPIRDKITPDLVAFINSWVPKLEMTIDQRKYFMTHGSPDELLTGYIYPDSDLSRYQVLDADVIILGHTHRPFFREEYGKVFINPGSVGLPRDQGNLSSLAIINTNPFSVSHYRLTMDVEALLSSIPPAEIHQMTINGLKRSAENGTFGEVIY